MTSPLPTTAKPATTPRLKVRALLLGERLDLGGLERSDALSSTPLAFRTGKTGFTALFRYGVAVFVDLTTLEEDEAIRSLKGRIVGAFSEPEEETAEIEISAAREDQIPPGGPIYIRELSLERLVLIADALAKSAALVRDEKETAAVFDALEPLVRHLADNGKRPRGRRSMLKHIGAALLVRQRVSGGVAVEEKPDVLWDRPDLERLYSRLEDEYELKERVTTLHHKLGVIGGTAQTLTDIIDTERAHWLELTIVLLIMFEIVITFVKMAFNLPGY